jgi:hypothetical protein
MWQNGLKYFVSGCILESQAKKWVDQNPKYVVKMYSCCVKKAEKYCCSQFMKQNVTII